GDAAHVAAHVVRGVEEEVERQLAGLASAVLQVRDRRAVRLLLPARALRDGVLLGVEEAGDLLATLDREVRLLDSVGPRGSHQTVASLKPWWAISSVSVAALAEAALSAGPCHLTGNAAMNCQLRTVLP